MFFSYNSLFNMNHNQSLALKIFWRWDVIYFRFMYIFDAGALSIEL